MALTDLEGAVVADWVARHPEDAALTDQLAGASVTGRKNTGAGYFTDLQPNRAAPPLSGERMRSACWAKVEGLPNGVRHMLWLEDGYLACIEGFTVGDDSSAVEWSTVTFKIMPPEQSPVRP